jgi:hypothetical protein
VFGAGARAIQTLDTSVPGCDGTLLANAPVHGVGHILEFDDQLSGDGIRRQAYQTPDDRDARGENLANTGKVRFDCRLDRRMGLHMRFHAARLLRPMGSVKVPPT